MTKNLDLQVRILYHAPKYKIERRTKMKVLVLGGDSISRSLVHALSLSLVLGDSLIRTLVDNEREEIKKRLLCDDDMAMKIRPIRVEDLAPLECKVNLPYQDDSFRGGSRGKGGKTKYERT